MAYSYLERFRSAVPTSQGNKILKTLRKKLESGAIRSIDEYRKRLQRLTTLLLENRIKPSLQIWKALENEDIYAECFNDMLQHTEDDLATAFEEANNIEEVLTAHNNLIKQVALKMVRRGTTKLSNQIRAYEFLRRTKYGFDDVLLNTFDESLPRPSDAVGDISYFLNRDPRSNEVLDKSHYASVDLIGESLIGGIRDLRKAAFQSAELRGNIDSTTTEIDASFAHSKLSNMLDEQQGTYWAIPILRRQPAPNGVTVELQFQLTVPQQLNYLELEPASDSAMQLDALYYLDTSNTLQEVELEEIVIAGPISISFAPIHARALIVRLKQENYTEIQFKKTDKDSAFYQAVNKEKWLDGTSEEARTYLSTTLTSSFILEDAFGLGTEETAEEVRYWQYIIGIDNIRAGHRTYWDTSYFISECKTIAYPGLVGFIGLERRPRLDTTTGVVDLPLFRYPIESITEDSYVYYGNLEYWVIARFYDSNKKIISTDTFPILPIGASRIYHERLILTHQIGTSKLCNDSGALLHYTEAQPGDVWIYQNYKRLTYGTDWTFVASGHASNLTVETSNTGRRMQRGVQLLITPSTTDLFTVSYTPVVSTTQALPYSTTLMKSIDLVGDEHVRVARNNFITIDSEHLSQKVTSADFYLLIILRQNSSAISFSPLLEEFAFTFGSQNDNKFVSSYV